jgi:deoxyribose-phosphate aldolase
MIRAIRDYHERTGMPLGHRQLSHSCAGFKVGFKPAGGVRQAKDALVWLSLMKEELGDDWTFPNLFRIGASALLTDIERQLFHHVTGRYASLHEIPLS